MLLDETFRVDPTGSRRWKFRALVCGAFGRSLFAADSSAARSAGQPTPAGLSGGQAATDNASKSTPVANQEIATKPSLGGEERGVQVFAFLHHTNDSHCGLPSAGDRKHPRATGAYQGTTGTSGGRDFQDFLDGTGIAIDTLVLAVEKGEGRCA